ncbi:MAG: trypsin-like peptidase domain-containing protein [Planctomycetota bacterium]
MPTKKSTLGQIRDALEEAFPLPADLEAPIVDVGTLKPFAAVTFGTQGTQGYTASITKYLLYVASQGKLVNLLEAASEHNASHAKLLTQLSERFVNPVEGIKSRLGAGIERIILDVDFEDVPVWINKFEAVSHAVCRVEPQQDSIQGYGTAFLVDENTVMTAAHVIEPFRSSEQAARHVRLRFDYAILESDPNEGVEYRLEPGVWLIEDGSASNLDYAILKLAPNPDDPRKRLPVELSKSATTEGHPLMIVQHPDAQPLKLASGVVGEAEDACIRYEVNTEPGSSGSPCLNIGLQAVGVHTHGADLNGGVAMTAIRSHSSKVGQLESLPNSNAAAHPVNPVEQQASITSGEGQEKRSIDILHVKVDRGIAEQLKDSLEELSYPISLRQLESMGSQSINVEDFLIVLLSPHASANPQLQFLLGAESVRRDSTQEGIDAVLLCKGLEPKHARDLEAYFDIYPETEEGLRSLHQKIAVWMDHSKDEQFSPENVIQQWGVLVNTFLVKATRLLSELAQDMPDIHEKHEVATRFIHTTASQFAEGQVRIVEPKEVYNHDRKTLDLLRPGESFLTTHPVSQVFGPAVKKDSKDGTRLAYREYIQAQKKAAKRGVKVRRIYIVPSVESVSKSDQVKKEIAELAKAKIEIKVIAEDDVALEDKMQQDFVIFSSKCLGLGFSVGPSPVVWSDYYIPRSIASEKMITNYTEYHGRLWENSLSLDDIGLDL